MATSRTQDYTIFKIVLLQNVLPQNVLAYKTSCLHNILSQNVQPQNVLPTKRPLHKTSPATKCPHHKTFFLQNILAYKTSLPTKHPSTKCPPPYKISTCSQQHLVYTNAYFLFPNSKYSFIKFSPHKTPAIQRFLLNIYRHFLYMYIDQIKTYKKAEYELIHTIIKHKILICTCKYLN